MKFAAKPKLRVPQSDSIKSKDVDRKTKNLKAKVVETATKPKRVKPVSSVLVTAPNNFPVALRDPEVVQALNSRFGTQADTIVEMISMGNADGASSLIIKALIQSVCEVLPMAEHYIRESKSTKGIYGFNTLVSTVRELLGDLQVLKDKATLGQSIVDRTIRPSYMDIAAQLVSSLTIVQESAKSRMSSSDYKEFRGTVEQSKKGMSDYMMAQYRDVSDQVVKSLG